MGYGKGLVAAVGAVLGPVIVVAGSELSAVGHRQTVVKITRMDARTATVKIAPPLPGNLVIRYPTQRRFT